MNLFRKSESAGGIEWLKENEGCSLFFSKYIIVLGLQIWVLLFIFSDKEKGFF